MGRDIISSLPEEILVHIVSFLDTRYAIRTGVLSKRWRFLWKKSSSIRLSEQEYMYHLGLQDASPSQYKEIRMSFISVVYRVLISNIPPILESLSISFRGCDSGGQQFLDVLVLFLTTWKKIKKLSIDIPNSEFHPGPLVYFISKSPCESITRLELSGCFQYFTSCEGFSSLETLVLRDFTVRKDSIERFFKSCPSLHSCTLERFRMDEDVFISAPWLKALKILQHEGVMLHYLDIAAPSLEDLQVEYSNVTEIKVRLHDMQSLTTLDHVAYLCEEDYHFHRFLCENIAKIGHVKKLQTNLLFDVVDEWRARNKNSMVIGPFDSLEELLLDEYSSRDLDALASLCTIAPKIRKLVLNPLEYVLRDQDSWLLYDDISCGSLEHLKLIQLNGINGETIYLRLIKLLLKSSNALESLEIKFWYRTDASTRLAFETELLTLQREGIPKIHFSIWQGKRYIPSW